MLILYFFLISGRDKSWSVGTELRQLKIYDEELSSPSNMRRMMTDNSARRHFIIDADVKVKKLFRLDMKVLRSIICNIMWLHLEMI